MLHPLVQLAIALVLFIAIIFFLPLKFEIKYSRNEEDDLLIVRFFLSSKWQLYKLKIAKLDATLPNFNTILDLNVRVEGINNSATGHEVEIKKPQAYLDSVYGRLKKGFKLIKINLKPIKKITEKFYRTICCQQLSWSTEIGFEDAALTALATGFLYYFKNSVYRNLKRNVKVSTKVPNFFVKPVFGKNCFNTNLLCIFKIRLGHIIITGIKFLLLLLESSVLKGGDQAD